MGDIPVTFEYKGKEYKGFLSEVSGAAGKTWFLMIDGFYCGQLLYLDSAAEFRFTSQTGEFKELVDYFASVIIAWYE
jgi:hypothetical protein